jgi:dual specificity phosphatase 12
MSQLEIFYKASFSVSKHDKAVRMFYLERLVKDVKSKRQLRACYGRDELRYYTGGKIVLGENALADYRPALDDGSPVTPEVSNRRIRCKMCRYFCLLFSLGKVQSKWFISRQELATREHMVDHGQLSSPTPAVSYSPVISAPSSFMGSLKTPISPSDAATNDLQDIPGPADVEQAAALGESISKKISESEGPSSTVYNSPVKSSNLSHAAELSAQLISNPMIAALRTGLTVVPAPSPSLTGVRASPILANSKCSGYFVEPVSAIIQYKMF